MSTVEYKFKTEEDLGFYILNAVCHDWIHDFNNYNRMRKIVNEIMQLVPDKSIPKPNIQQAVSTAMEQEKTVPEPETFEIQIATEDRNLDDTTLIQASVAPSDEKMPYEETIAPETAPNPEPTVDELYKSQEEYYLNEEVPTVPDIVAVAEGPHQAIVNESIEFYKFIKSTTRNKMTRGNVRKINILQKLESFIGESQLLVISKISDSAGAGGGKMHGGSGIDIITESHIVSAIDMIIKEINETDANDVIITKIEKKITETDGKTMNAHLINIFTLMREAFILLEITSVSPMEKFNSSLIKEITGMFILNKCNTLDIKKEAELYLKLYLPSKQDEKTRVLQKPQDTISSKKNITTDVRHNIFSNILPNVLGRTSFFGGSNFSAKKYTDNQNSFSTLETAISSIRASILNSIYTGTEKASSEKKDECLTAYDNFVKEVDKKTLELIIGPQMYNARTKEIKNLSTTLGNPSGRNYEKNLNKLVDTITDFVFDKIIQPYEDIKNQVNAHLKKSESSPASKTPFPSVAKASVQKISQLLAKKILELTGYANAKTNNADLNEQIAIITSVANGVDYEKVDEKLINYFNQKYNKNTYIQKGKPANNNLINAMNTAPEPRVINNAIPNGDVKNEIVGKVVCPTSSVCDGMGAFGSCQSPTAVQKEYYNMDYSISAGDGSNYYYGTTTLKENKRAVNITYGYNFNDLNLYNSFDINISSPPIQLQANYSFAGVINRIVQIWKSSTTTTSIDGLWELLENDAFFMSILKAGSPKSIGDIFQEVNSSLANGGYSNPNTGVSAKTTFGLMGDRPSGVRVLKLLDDALSGKNNNAYGGYIGDTTSLIYLPSTLPPPPPPKGKPSTKKKGGKKTIKKHKKTASKLTKKH